MKKSSAVYVATISQASAVSVLNVVRRYDTESIFITFTSLDVAIIILVSFSFFIKVYIEKCRVGSTFTTGADGKYKT